MIHIECQIILNEHKREEMKNFNGFSNSNKVLEDSNDLLIVSVIDSGIGIA